MTKMKGLSPRPEDAAPNQEHNPVKDSLAAVLGILIILGFGAFIWYLMGNLGLSETEWARAMVLFGGVEAVAFAAAGYFFGTQVQRGNVQEAKAEAEAASKVARRADEVAEAERTTSTMLAEGIVTTATPSEGGLLGEESASPGLDALKAQAQAVLRERGRR